MSLNRIITKYELMNLPNEQIAGYLKGRYVKLVLNSGEYKEARIQNLLAAANPPHLFVGFLTEDNYSINLLDIDHIEI